MRHLTYISVATVYQKMWFTWLHVKSEKCNILVHLLRAIYMYKIMKKMYKIRLQRHCYETCNKWTKWQDVFCWHQNFVPWGLSAPTLGLYTCIKSFKKSDFKEIFCFWKLATNEWSERCFCWHQNFVPWDLSAPAPGLYTCIKSWKNCIKSDFKEIFSSPEPKAQWWAYKMVRLCRPYVCMYVCMCVCVCVNIFKNLLLRNHWANQSQISYGASIEWGNESLFNWSRSHNQDGRHAHLWYKP